MRLNRKIVAGKDLPIILDKCIITHLQRLTVSRKIIKDKYIKFLLNYSKTVIYTLFKFLPFYKQKEESD